MENQTVGRLIAGTLAAMLLVTLPAAAPATAAQADPGPPDQQTLDAFRDEWGLTDFRETRIGDWQTLSTWERATQFAFAPGSNEFTATPAREAGLAPLRLEIFGRTARNKTQFQVTEITGSTDGTETPNYFPIFSGTPAAMKFFNAAGVPGLPPGEINERCRDFLKADRHFLLCRMIASDRSIRYQTKVAQGSNPAEGLPSLDEVLGAFRDQWGSNTFRPSGATAWILPWSPQLFSMPQI